MTTTTAPPRSGLILLALFALTFAISAQFLVVTPLLPEIRDQLGVDEGYLGFLVTSYAIGVGVFSLLAGPVSDYVGRRVILLIGSTGMAIALLLHGLAYSFELLLAVRLAAGCAAGLMAGATVAYVGDAFPYAQRGRANGIIATGFAAGQILGIPAGAWLGEIGYRIPFTSFGVAVGLAAVLIAVFVPQPDVELADTLSVRSAIVGYAELLSRGATAASAAAYAIMFLGVSLFITYLPTWLNARFGVTPTEVATLFVAGGIANLIMGPIAGGLSDRVGRKVLVVTGSTAAGLMMAAVPWITPRFWVAYPLFFIIMIFVAMRISPMQALVSSLVPARQRGTLLALAFAIGQVGFGLGALLSGVLYTGYGFVVTAVVGGSMAATMALVVALFIPEPREDLDEEPARAPDAARPATAPPPAAPPESA